MREGPVTDAGRRRRRRRKLDAQDVGPSRPGEAGVIVCGLIGGSAAARAVTLAPTAQTKLYQDPNARGSHGVILPLSLSALSSPQRRVQHGWRRAVRFQEASPAAVQIPYDMSMQSVRQSNVHSTLLPATPRTCLTCKNCCRSWIMGD